MGSFISYIACQQYSRSRRMLTPIFELKEKLPNNQNLSCKLHDSQAVNIGSCLLCTSPCTICESKLCIKSHKQNQKVHNVMTVDYIRHVVNEFCNTSHQKKKVMKKMVFDYFQFAKKELDELHSRVRSAIENFMFDNIVFLNEEQNMIAKLINEKYCELTCEEIARILPKMIKATNMEEGYFEHLRDYLRLERDKISKFFDVNLLNLPYFRKPMDLREITLKRENENKYCEINSDLLKDVNKKMEEITNQPHILCIKYRTQQSMQSMQSQVQAQDEGNEEQRVRFIRNLCKISNLNCLEKLEIYCLWDIKEQDFQIAFFQALENFPFLKSVKIVTGYQVTDMGFIDEIVEDKFDVIIQKEPWKF